MNFAVDAGLIASNPAIGVRKVKAKTQGFATWTEQDIALFESKHPLGSRARTRIGASALQAKDDPM
jgi:hypothetical protein